MYNAGMNKVLQNYLTVSQAADDFGVSRQRMHVLLRTYDVPFETLPNGMKVMKRAALKRIPRDRPSGWTSARIKKLQKIA